jgi:hypothetical protein
VPPLPVQLSLSTAEANLARGGFSLRNSPDEVAVRLGLSKFDALPVLISRGRKKLDCNSRKVAAPKAPKERARFMYALSKKKLSAPKPRGLRNHEAWGNVAAEHLFRTRELDETRESLTWIDCAPELDFPLK